MKFNRTSGTERYLKAATRGLWGRQRRALRDELKGHIDTRIQEFRLGGLSEPDAERQTLRELGAPMQVSSGMLGVHTLPALGKAGMLTALLTTGLLTVLPQGLAQVGSIYTVPQVSASPQSNVQYGASSYLDYAQLKMELVKAGAQLNGPINKATLVLPGTPRPTQLLELGAPRYGSTLAQNGRSYILADTLVNGFANSGADVSVSGWVNPVLQAGKTRVQIQTDDWRIVSSLYLRTLGSPELTAGNALSMLESNGDTGVLNLVGTLKTDKVYAGLWPLTGGAAGCSPCQT